MTRNFEMSKKLTDKALVKFVANAMYGKNSWTVWEIKAGGGKRTNFEAKTRSFAYDLPYNCTVTLYSARAFHGKSVN